MSETPPPLLPTELFLLKASKKHFKTPGCSPAPCSRSFDSSTFPPSLVPYHSFRDPRNGPPQARPCFKSSRTVFRFDLTHPLLNLLFRPGALACNSLSSPPIRPPTLPEVFSPPSDFFFLFRPDYMAPLYFSNFTRNGEVSFLVSSG